MRAKHSMRAAALVVALLVMALATTLAVSFAALVDLNAQSANATANAEAALAAAETGLQHVVAILRNLYIGDGSPEALRQAVADRLGFFLDGTANLGGASLVSSTEALTIPEIRLGDDQRYALRLTFPTGGVRIESTGRCDRAVRRVRIDMDAQVGVSPVFDFGVASKGRISVSGQAGILGVNDPSEADILSATYSDPEAVTLSGTTVIDGEVYTANPLSYVRTLGGNISVGGDGVSLVDDHIHIGVGQVEFPSIDVSAFTPLATTVFDPAAGPVWENIRIPPDTNPTFASDVELRGVIYIEQPNDVNFAGRVLLTGTIVTDDSPAGESSLTFSGQVLSQDFDQLPDEPRFDALKDMEGATLLAPGFDVSFSGQANVFNGALAAESFRFSGQAGGVIYGPVIGYGDTEFDLLGQCELAIDRSRYSGDPPGFSTTWWLQPVKGSYAQVYD